VFEGFSLEEIDVVGARLRVRHGGAGPAVVLLHGHPRTHTTWWRVAPELARDCTVVCPDLRGYGRSSKPPTTDDHRPYSKRAMAGDVVALMRALGHERFAAVGHDRGGAVAFRTAMDAPEAVTHLVAMDALPIAAHLRRADARFAAAWWHWFFLGQTAKPAERIITLDPDTWYNAWTTNRPERLGAENHADFLAAIRDPATVHAMCEDYRAGLGVDRADDEADLAAGRRIRCPATLLWAVRDDLEELYGDPLEPWRPWCPQITGQGIDSGHHLAEEAPGAVVEALRTALT